MSKLTNQQQQAVETIDKHVLVCAGAGSGKTHVLIERFVHILRSDPTLAVAQVVAVTFTRKAASEMRNRLKAKFRELQELEPENSQRWNECLNEVDGARIGTIHSLCETIIKCFPVDAGIDPQFELIDELTHVEMISDAIDQAFREAMVDNDSDWQLLFFEFDIDDLRRLVAEAIKSSRFAEASRTLAWQDQEALNMHVSAVLLEARRRLLDEIIHHREWPRNILAIETTTLAATNNLETLRKEFLGFAETLSQSISAGGDLEPLRLSRAWEAACAIASQQVNSTGGRSEECKELRARMKIVRELCKKRTSKLPRHPVPDEERAWQCIRAIAMLVHKAKRVYEERKKKELRLDYNDLIALAFAALHRDQSAALKFFRDTVRTLLVDEFQDTNAAQSELLSLIAGPEAKFFLIGDDKQSIYRFQGADVATFNRWRRQFEISHSSVTLSLSNSFRSHPQLVRLTNLVFSRLMESNESKDGADSNDSNGYHDGHAAIFEPLVAMREDVDGERVQLIAYGGDQEELTEDQLVLAKTKDPEKRRRREAEALADWVEWHVETGTLILDKASNSERAAQFGDFAVLVPRNADFLLIERMLTMRSIPTCVIAGKGYLDRQEIHDLENLLRFLSAPQDDHALLAILRSPMFAISDDVLHRIATEGRTRGAQSLWQKVQQYARKLARQQSMTERAQSPEAEAQKVKAQPTAGQQTNERQINESQTITQQDQPFEPGDKMSTLTRAVQILRDLFAQKEFQSLCELLRTIISRTHYDLLLLSTPDGAQRSRNIWKLVSIAAEHTELGCGEFADLLWRMRKAEVKIGDAPVNRENAVKIMTIHSAKGLEFPFVALPALSVRGAHKSDRLLYHKEYGIAFNTARSDEDEKPMWYQACKVIDEQMEAAERKRLFYVAVTRARDYMAFLVDREAATDGTFSGWLLDGLELQPEELCENHEKILRFGDDHLRVRILQHSDLKELMRARHTDPHEVEGFLSRLKETVGEDCSPESAAETLMVHGQANPQPETGFAVIADEGGQMKFLFPDQAAEEPQLESFESFESFAPDTDSQGQVTDDTTLTSPALTPTEPFPLLEAIPQAAFDFPPAWLGSLRVSSPGEVPVFPATVIGTFFHSLMENMPGDGRRLDREMIEAIAASQSGFVAVPGNVKDLSDLGDELLEQLYKSDFYQLFLHAVERLHEMPYLFNRNGVIHSKRPDLLLKLANNKWLLIDFKTDNFSQSELERHSRDHAEQLAVYVEELGELLHIRLEPFIYYARYGLLHACQ